jgi:hypothetical protein
MSQQHRDFTANRALVLATEEVAQSLLRVIFICKKPDLTLPQEDQDRMRQIGDDLESAWNRLQELIKRYPPIRYC